MQLPQLWVPPQPSPWLPQLKPWEAQLRAVHMPPPHWPGVPPPPQVAGETHVPQLS